MQKQKLTVKLNNVFTGREFFFLFFWLNDITTIFSIIHRLMTSPDCSVRTTQNE